MIHILKSYLKFLWQSKNEHGIHSPFVYDLVTNCFYDNNKYFEYELLDNYRYDLLANKSTIEVTDFGAGSKIFKSNTRQIAKIAKTAGITSKNAKLLFRIVNYFQPNDILEIGTSLGLATYVFALSPNKPNLITIEGCEETIKFTKNKFLRIFNFDDYDRINFICSEFSNFLKGKPIFSKQGWKLIYFDGNHSKKATLDYFESLLPTVTNETLWIFDDIHWSKDMEEAWEVIKEHPNVKVTIDTFQWGIVFFREEQEKEHFIINPNPTLSSILLKKIRI